MTGNISPNFVLFETTSGKILISCCPVIETSESYLSKRLEKHNMSRFTFLKTSKNIYLKQFPVVEHRKDEASVTAAI